MEKIKETWIMDPERANCGIPQFYELVADAMYDRTFAHYDCTKVECGKDILEAIREYYREQGVEDFDFNMMWVCYGPKATLEGYEVQVEEGWATDD